MRVSLKPPTYASPDRAGNSALTKPTFKSIDIR